jgi:dTDP-4-dehydrorhamnose reductase
LLTGSGGQLSREFQKRLSSGRYVLYAPSEDSLDITDSAAVADAFSLTCPDVVINCAAYNDVDGAEGDYETAHKVNALGPKILAAASRKQKALFIHYSTDYVFDGRKEGFYAEEDVPCPLNRYGESKRAGEIFVAEEGGRYLIFRTSWLYGEGTQNFLRKLKGWAEKTQVLKVVADQVSVPTYTEDVVSATLEACEKGLQGLYHLVNSGYATRYEVARYFLGKTGSKAIVLPVNTSLFPGPARRPYFSAMSSAKLASAIGREIPHWKDAMDRYVRNAGLQEDAI